MALIQLRRGTAAEWIAANPILALGEPGVETDTRLWKVGTGSLAWNSLSYFNTGGGGGGGDFLGLTDTPDDYVGDARKLVVVKPDEGGLEFLSPPTVGNVMRAGSATFGDNFVEYVFASNQTDIWLTFDVLFHADALAFWTSNEFSGAFAEILNNLLTGFSGLMLNKFFDTSLVWANPFFGGHGTVTPAAEVWHKCELHYTSASTKTDCYIDGALEFSFDELTAGNVIDRIRIGQFDASPTSSTAVAYFRNIMAGTSRGGRDLFFDNFATGDTSRWNSTVGDVTVIGNPFPSWVSNFLDLSDTPDTYVGQSLKTVRVKSNESGLEFVLGGATIIRNFTFGLRKSGGLVTGKLPGFWTCMFNGTISAWNIIVDTGTITLKIWKIATGTTKPTSANSINTSGIAPIPGNTAIRSTSLGDFTTLAVVAGDIFAAQITAVSGVTDFGGSIEITQG